jgi:hypothetical protein
LRIDRIREALDRGGVRLRAIADVGSARVPAAIDVGFGDVLEPGAAVIDYPMLLDRPAPKLRAYACERVTDDKLRRTMLPSLPLDCFTLCYIVDIVDENKFSTEKYRRENGHKVTLLILLD